MSSYKVYIIVAVVVSISFIIYNLLRPRYLKLYSLIVYVNPRWTYQTESTIEEWIEAWKIVKHASPSFWMKRNQGTVELSAMLMSSFV